MKKVLTFCVVLAALGGVAYAHDVPSTSGDKATELVQPADDGRGRESLDNCANPFPENFESATAPSTFPACWIQINNNAGNYWLVAGSGGCAAAKCASIGYQAPQLDDWLMSPGVVLTGGTTYTLTFSWKGKSLNYTERWEIKYGTAQTIAGMTNTILAQVSFTPTDFLCHQATYTFTPAANGIYYIGWHMTSLDAMGIFLDDFDVTPHTWPVYGRCCYGNPEAPSCANNTQTECSALGGTWDGTKTCSTPCPVQFVCHAQEPLAGRHCFTGGPIADNSTTDFTLNIPVEYHITDVNVALDIAHTYDGDLKVTLISPSGTMVQLFSGIGGSSDNFTCTTLDDEAATAISGFIPAPFSGTYKPQVPALLSAFDGQNATGNWILRIQDMYSGDFGPLNWVCLTFTWDMILPRPVQIGDHFCLRFVPGREEVVYWCCPFDGPPVFSWLPGCDYQIPGCQEACTPYPGPVMWVAQRDSSNANCPLPGGWWSARFTAAGEGCVCVSFDEQLAVELTTFAAVAGDGQVELRWSTASETDNDHFNVYRATEGSDRGLIGTVAGHGTVASAHHYTFVDRSVSNGVNYEYRLAAVDINGAIEWVGDDVTATPGAANSTTPTEYALHQNYPNPFNPTTSIVYDMKEAGFVSLKVYNMLGQAVATLVNGNMSEGRHSAHFDASALPSGIYLYKIEVNGFSDEKKMLLMK